MSEHDTDELESTNQSTEEVDNTEAVEDESTNDESEDLSALQEKNKRLFERAKKAEAEAKLLKAERLKKEETVKAQVKTEPSQKQDSFDLEDVAVLVQKVSVKEDRELVKDYAKYKKISLEEALNNPIIQAELKDKAEKRQTSNATNTGPARRGSTKLTDDQILSNVEQGKFPENPEDLAEARFSNKKKK